MRAGSKTGDQVSRRFQSRFRAYFGLGVETINQVDSSGTVDRGFQKAYVQIRERRLP